MKMSDSKIIKLLIFLALAMFVLQLSPHAAAETEGKISGTEVQQEMPQETQLSSDSTTSTTLENGEIYTSLGETPTMSLLSGAGEPVLPPVAPSAIGGAFSSLMSESFKTDLATGAATLSIPIVVPAGRKNVQPNIALFYSSNNSNDICGVGWAFPISAIQRSTKKGVPRYDHMEDFVAGGEELVDIGGGEYRAKIESSFTKYVFLSSENKWVAYDKLGTQYHFGTTDASRMSNPDNPNYIFAWYIDKVVDVYGNGMTYSYIKEDNNTYLKYIYYTSNLECNPILNADKQIEFVYESTERPDKLYNNRTGWPSTMRRRLEKIVVSIDYNRNLVWEAGEAVWSYNLNYTLSPDTSRSLLISIQLKDNNGNGLPAKTFAYQRLE